jgi:hypothetical protein
MPDVVTFALVNADGTPKTDATPAFSSAGADYRARNGITRAVVPAITQVQRLGVNTGTYEFTASDDDLAEGVVWAIDSGAGAYPARLAGGVYRDSRPFVVMLLTTGAGALWTGAAPTVGYYLDAANNVLTSPTPTAAAPHLYTVTPSLADLRVGVKTRLDAPATAYPSFVTAEFDAQGGTATPTGAGVPAQTSTAIAFSAAAYLRQLRALLPPGKAFNYDPDSVVSKCLAAYADELARIDARGVQLIEESDPRTAEETIEQWEAMLSLPDEQVPVIPATLAERRIAVTQKYANRGGQNLDFFVRLAAACGYVVEDRLLGTPADDGNGEVDNGGGVLPDDTYTYYVSAESPYGEGPLSAPIVFTVVAGTGASIRISCTPVDGATRYRYYGRTGGDVKLITWTTGPAIDDDGGFSPGTATPAPTPSVLAYKGIELFANSVLRANFRCGDRCYAEAYAYSMLVNAQTPAGPAMAQADFERVIRHVAHAHVFVWFRYHP